jgi:hypothetical protein
MFEETLLDAPWTASDATATWGALRALGLAFSGASHGHRHSADQWAGRGGPALPFLVGGAAQPCWVFTATGDRRYTIIPAATVSLVPGSMRMKEPVERLRR